MVCRRVVGMLFALLVVPGLASGAASPRAELEAFFDRAKGLLEASDGEKARAEFQGLTHALFDGRAAARQALGAEWDSRTVAEREEFARVFGDVFERAYLEIVQGQLPRSRPPSVRVLGEDVTDGRQAVVRTTVKARDGRDVRMDYAMTQAGERWRIHDVAIEGVSLVDNYRAQFARVLRKAPYADLRGRLQAAAGPAASDDDAAVDLVVYFRANGAELAADARRELDRVAPKLAANGRARIVVEGHADGRGNTRLNEALAERRAVAIRQHLVATGIDPDRITVVGHGDRQPVCQDQAETCWARNRRASVRSSP